MPASRDSDSTPDSRCVPLDYHRVFREVQAALQTVTAVVSRSHELGSCGNGGALYAV